MATRHATETAEGWVHEHREWVWRSSDRELSIRCSFSEATGLWGFRFCRMTNMIVEYPDVASTPEGAKVIAGWWYDGYCAGRNRL